MCWKSNFPTISMLFALEQITSKVCLKTMLNNNKINILILIANLLRIGSLSPPCCRICNIAPKELTFLKSFIDLLDQYTETDKKDECGHITTDPPLIVCSEELELPPDDCTHVVIPTKDASLCETKSTAEEEICGEEYTTTTTTTENPCSVEQEEVDMDPALCEDDTIITRTIMEDPCFEEQPIAECEEPCEVEEQIVEELPCLDEEPCFDEDPCPEDEVIVNPPIGVYCEEDVIEGTPIVLPVEPDDGIGDNPCECQHVVVDEPTEDADCEIEEEDDEDDLCDSLPIIEVSELFARHLKASACGCLSVKDCDTGEIKPPILTVPWWATC